MTSAWIMTQSRTAVTLQYLLLPHVSLGRREKVHIYRILSSLLCVVFSHASPHTGTQYHSHKAEDSFRLKFDLNLVTHKLLYLCLYYHVQSNHGNNNTN